MSEVFSSSAQEADTHRDAETAVVVTLDWLFREEIARVEAMFGTPYRKGITAGLRDYRAKVAGNFSGFVHSPAHYADRSIKTWGDGRKVGWERAAKIEADWQDSRRAAILKATTPAETDAVGTERSEVHKNPEPKETGE